MNLRFSRTRGFGVSKLRKCGVIFCVLLAPLCAQAVSPQSSTRTQPTQTPTATLERGTLERARVLLSINDARALPMLREIALRALNDFAANPNSENQKVAVIAALWRGEAAQKFGARDEAIESWAQGLATRRVLKSLNRNALLLPSSDETELRTSLDAILLSGLPTISTWETLQNLSFDSPKSAWKPAIYAFPFPDFGVIEYSNERKTTLREFCITKGNLPLSVAQTPTLYRTFSVASLPRELKMNAQVVGYARENETSWRQKVRVFYSSVDATEQSRAEKIGAQFLRVQSVYENFLGRRNTYSTDGVTTIWLSRLPAEWPQTAPGEGWNAGAWIDSSPDQMILFRTNETRSDAEWLRETAHEFSHIAFPPFAGFASPLEPFGNGRLGETLLMLWANDSPQSFFAPDEIEIAQKNCRVHVQRYAIPALQTWLKTDPMKPLSVAGDENALKQLVGLAVEIERVYGAKVLRRALDETVPNGYGKWRESAIEYSMRRNASSKPAVLRASDLLRAFQTAMKSTPRNSSIWIAGALQKQNSNGEIVPLSADEMTQRAPLKLRKNESASGWIWFPPNMKLRIFSDEIASLKIESDAKIISARDSVSVSTGKSGWRKIGLRALNDVTIQSAQFE